MSKPITQNLNVEIARLGLHAQMHSKKIFKWFTLDMIIYVLINIVMLFSLGDRLINIQNIGFFKLLILGLAAYRGANIISNETVTKPLRAPFVNEKEVHGHLVEEPKKRGWKGAFGTLIYCPSCTGVWIGMFLLYSYAFFPSVMFAGWLLLASSALERIFAFSVGYLKKNGTGKEPY
jgi:hypothetical protein